MVTIAVGTFVLAFLQLTRLIAGKAFRTGLRPGEKLYEELSYGDNLRKTNHPYIKTAVEESITITELENLLVLLKEALAGNDLSRILKIVSTVSPNISRLIKN